MKNLETKDFEESYELEAKKQKPYEEESLKNVQERISSIENKEKNSADLELAYSSSLMELREKFPGIPEDLTNKRVNIRYKESDGRYQNLFLFSDGLSTWCYGKNLAINKIGDLWVSSASSSHKTQSGMIEDRRESFTLSEFNTGIEKILSNADKCEITVEELDGPRFPQ